jgi:hypothetical protein
MVQDYRYLLTSLKIEFVFLFVVLCIVWDYFLKDKGVFKYLYSSILKPDNSGTLSASILMSIWFLSIGLIIM